MEHFYREIGPYKLLMNKMDVAAIKRVEAVKGGRYMATYGQGTLKVHVFYQDEAHPQGSNYFGLFYKLTPFHQDRQLMICDGKRFVEQPITAAICKDGVTLIYSSDTRDYQISPLKNDDTMIDGGFDYTRTNRDAQLVKIGVVDDKFVILTDDTQPSEPVRAL